VAGLEVIRSSSGVSKPVIELVTVAHARISA
jgi:hypothetical protein